MRIEPKKAVIIGCGGIGSHLAHGLAMQLEHHAPRSTLVLVDGDVFEPKNSIRQEFTKLGNKAMVVRDDIKDRARNTFVLARPVWIVAEAPNSDDEDAAYMTPADIIDEGDHVFCVVDNYAARKLVLDYASTLDNIDIYTGGNGSVETGDPLEGSIYHYVRRDGEDVTMHPAVMHQEFVNPQDRNPGELSCQERAALDGGTQLAAINIAVASFLLARAAHSIFGTEQEKQAAYTKAEIYFDLNEGLALPYDRRPAQVPSVV